MQVCFLLLDLCSDKKHHDPLLLDRLYFLCFSSHHFQHTHAFFFCPAVVIFPYVCKALSLSCCSLSFQQCLVTSQSTRQCSLTPAKMAPSPSPTPSSPALQTSSSSSCPALRPVRWHSLHAELKFNLTAALKANETVMWCTNVYTEHLPHYLGVVTLS